MTNEKQGMPKCTKDKELWEPEKRVERKGDSRFQATRASKMRIRSRNECEFQGNPLQRNRSIDEEQGTDNTWLPLIGYCAQIFAPRAESCVASAGELYMGVSRFSVMELLPWDISKGFGVAADRP